MLADAGTSNSVERRRKIFDRADRCELVQELCASVADSARGLRATTLLLLALENTDERFEILFEFSSRKLRANRVTIEAGDQLADLLDRGWRHGRRADRAAHTEVAARDDVTAALRKFTDQMSTSHGVPFGVCEQRDVPPEDHRDLR
ncbi:MAG: hypothetical protein AB7T06_04525 [Kofleriaceae bacterium]